MSCIGTLPPAAADFPERKNQRKSKGNTNAMYNSRSNDVKSSYSLIPP